MQEDTSLLRKIVNKKLVANGYNELRGYKTKEQLRVILGKYCGEGRSRGQLIVKTIKKQKFVPTNGFKPGVSGNPNGRPKGVENFKTVFEKALKNVAALNKIEPDDLYAQIISKGIAKARAGDYRFYKDTLDRLHGKAPDKLDVTSMGEKLDMGNKIAFVNFQQQNVADSE